MKKNLAKILADVHFYFSQKWKKNPIATQEKWFRNLIQKGSNTQFGKDHDFESIETLKDFQDKVPIRSYEELLPYIDRIVNGEEDILWPHKPAYFAKTSGTTAGAKYIPITKESMKFQIASARSALFHYIHRNNADFVDGKMIFLQGSPELTNTNGIPTGRLSGIVAHTIPSYLQTNRMPSWETNCIEDWEEKVDAIVEETVNENMTLISGIPPWLIMYFEKLLAASGEKNIISLFPNLQLIVTGGVNYEPYAGKIQELLGGKVDIIQTFPASEGFFAFQDADADDALLLLLNHGIFYEFVPLDELHLEKPTRLTLSQVELNKDYALILSTNAGLWAYNIGDTIRFVNKKPYRIIVSGRTKHYTSAFGEHVIAHEIETALQKTTEQFPVKIREFTMAPQVNPDKGLPYHEWLIEFAEEPENLEQFSQVLDENLQKLNPYYLDLVQGKVLKPLVITPLKENSFVDYMKSKGKMDAQNKVPRLSNHREIADELYRINQI